MVSDNSVKRNVVFFQNRQEGDRPDHIIQGRISGIIEIAGMDHGIDFH